MYCYNTYLYNNLNNEYYVFVIFLLMCIQLIIIYEKKNCFLLHENLEKNIDVIYFFLNLYISSNNILIVLIYLK